MCRQYRRFWPAYRRLLERGRPPGQGQVAKAGDHFSNVVGDQTHVHTAACTGGIGRQDFLKFGRELRERAKKPFDAVGSVDCERDFMRTRFICNKCRSATGR